MSNAIRAMLNVGPLSVCTGVTAWSIYRLYQYTFDSENESIKMSCHGNLSTPLDASTQQAVDKVIDKLLFTSTPKQIAVTQFYYCNKPSIQVRGGTMSRFGTFIGIPLHFKYEKPSEVDLSDLQKTSTDRSELLDRLKETLVLSENAKKFAISSTFFKTDSYYLLAMVDSVVTIFAFYLSMQYLFLPYVLKATYPMALLITVAVGLVWAEIHYYLNGLYNRRLTAKSDRRAAVLGDDFLEGGYEYLSKMAEKNRILRELNPEGAVTTFEPSDDYIQRMFGLQELTMTQRLNILKAWTERQDKERQNKQEKQSTSATEAKQGS